MTNISIRGLSKTFERDSRVTRALELVDLEIASGEFVAIVGPSGCGKSTLLRLIAGLLSPTTGEVVIEGSRVASAYKNCGIVFQKATLLQWRNTLENVMLQIEMRGIERSRFLGRAKELLRTVGLSDFADRYPHELSGGMQQRAAIARALIHEPPLLLMDEPFGALDALTREQMRIDLETIWLTNPKTVIFITHSIEEAVLLADRIIVMTPRPARIERIFEVGIPRPRGFGGKKHEAFDAIVEEITDIFLSRGVFH